jgi:hypothetical protein
MDKIKKALLDDCREHLILAVGSAAGAGEHETAARINAILVDIDIACEMCYTGKNARKARENEEVNKMAKWLDIWKVMYNPSGCGAVPYYFNDKTEAEKFANRNYADMPVRVAATKSGDIPITVYKTADNADRDNGHTEYI